MKIFVDDGSDSQVSQKMRRQQLNDREAWFIITQINVLFQIFISGFSEVNDSSKSQKLLFLSVIIFDKFSSLN